MSHSIIRIAPICGSRGGPQYVIVGLDYCNECWVWGLFSFFSISGYGKQIYGGVSQNIWGGPIANNRVPYV